MKRLISMILVLILFTAAGGCTREEKEAPRLRVVASFYPIYIMALNLVDGVPGVQLQSMAGQQTGCLHDFQMQTDDMKHLEQANALLVNGAGMESFLDKVVRELPALRVIDSSTGIPLIEAGEDEHHHGEEEDPHDHGEANPHLWVSVGNCICQVENLAEGLMALDPEYAAKYRENADAYIAKLKELQNRMHAELDTLPGREIITFHEAFPYFAEEFGLHIAAVINREPGSEPNARELAETIRLVEDTGVKALFVEPQYPETAADIVARETDARVYVLDPAVTGEESKDAYLCAMEANLAVLKEALS